MKVDKTCKVDRAERRDEMGIEQTGDMQQTSDRLV